MLSGATLIYILMVMVGDFLAIVVGFVLAYILRINLGVEVGGSGQVYEPVAAADYLVAFLVISPIWLLVFNALKLYDADIYFNRLHELARLFVGASIGILLVIGYEFFTEDDIFSGRLIAVYGFIITYILLVVERQMVRWFRQRMFRYNRGVSRLLLVGNTEATSKLAKLLSDTKVTGYNIVGIVGSKKVVPKEFKGKHFTNLQVALDSASALHVTTIVQTEFFASSAKNKKIMQKVIDDHLGYRFIPTQEEFFTGNHSVDVFHGYPIVSVHRTRLFGWGKVYKRLFDVVAGGSLLILFSPLMLLSAIMILIFDFGPVIFKQKRISRYGERVKIYKFRTMKKEYSGRSPVQVFTEMGRQDLIEEHKKVGHQIEDDPRCTKVGNFMRKFSLDELPQLINVIKGDISLVGPRAIVPEELRLFKEFGKPMLEVKTGITGLAQVSGRSDISHDERAQLNLYYVQNWSFWLDIRILIKTGRKFLTGR